MRKGNSTASLDLAVKRTVSAVLHRAAFGRDKKSRAKVAAEMSRLLNRPVTIRILDNFIAKKKIHRFPAAWVPAFCAATGDQTLLRMLPALAGLHVIDDREFALLQWAKKQQKINRLQLRSARALDSLSKSFRKSQPGETL